MQIASCKPYHAHLVGKTLLRMPDQRSVFKLYYLSITGRDNPKRYEWRHSPLSQSSFEQNLLSNGFTGVGFIIAFPHITKIFRFSPQGETTLDVIELDTQGLKSRDNSRGDGSHEFACYAEAVIAAGEYHAWAKAKTIDEYLVYFSSEDDFPIENHQKLAGYWNS